MDEWILSLIGKQLSLYKILNLNAVLMVEAFDMLMEYDSGMVIEDFKIPVGYDLGSFEEFFYLKRQPLGEFIIVLKEGGLFYFLSDHFSDFTAVCKQYDWYVISHQSFNK